MTQTSKIIFTFPNDRPKYFYICCMSKITEGKIEGISTPAQFAEKYDLSVDTVYRWIANTEFHKKFKMYDHRVVEMAGRKYLQEVKPQTTSL